MATIWTACKDRGSHNNVEPVALELVRRGHNVIRIASGRAAESYARAGTPHLSHFSAHEIVKALSLPDLLFTGMSVGDDAGRDLIPLILNTVPIVAQQDWWGGVLKTDWSAREFRPDCIFVNDQAGKEIVLANWLDMCDEEVRALGYPFYDEFARTDVEKVCAETRVKLGIPENARVVFFAGSCARPEAHAVISEGEILSEVLTALEDPRIEKEEFVLIVRPHPGLGNLVPDEKDGWDAALKQYRGKLVDSSGCTTNEVTATADVVVSMTSSVLVEAALMRKQVVSVLYPIMKERFIMEVGGAMTEFPLAELGCCVTATNRSEITAKIDLALACKLDLRSAQEEHLRADGGNTARVTDFLESLIL